MSITIVKIAGQATGASTNTLVFGAPGVSAGDALAIAVSMPHGFTVVSLTDNAIGGSNSYCRSARRLTRQPEHSDKLQKQSVVNQIN